VSIKGHILIIIIIINALIKVTLSQGLQLLQGFPRSKQSQKGHHFALKIFQAAFAVVGPQIWNSLPADLRLVDNYARFRRLLKGHMFGSGCGA